MRLHFDSSVSSTMAQNWRAISGFHIRVYHGACGERKTKKKASSHSSVELDSSLALWSETRKWPRLSEWNRSEISSSHCYTVSQWERELARGEHHVIKQHITWRSSSSLVQYMNLARVNHSFAETQKPILAIFLNQTIPLIFAAHWRQN